MSAGQRILHIWPDGNSRLLCVQGFGIWCTGQSLLSVLAPQILYTSIPAYLLEIFRCYWVQALDQQRKEIMLGIIAALICVICAAAYIYLKRKYRYWKNLGIPGPEPLMVVGNMKEMFSLKATEPAMMHQWYKDFRNEPFIGYYNFWTPCLLVLDPELIKAITEVDFNSFIDHPNVLTDTQKDSVLDSLFTMKGARWKAKRQIFSKLFSPKKLRELSNVVDKQNDIILKKIEENLQPTDEIHMTEVLEQLILKALMSFLYGIDSSQNMGSYSKLTELSEIFARPRETTVLRFLLYTVFPNIYEKLRFSAFSGIFYDYFSRFTKDLMHYRNEMNIDRDDLVSLVGKMQKEAVLGSEKINHDEAVGHLFSFYIAGHHTTMTTLSHVIFQLALHPEVQEKLRIEVDSVLKGKTTITYDDIKEMNYLDQVINETMRLFPLLGVLKRVCTQPYKISDKFTIPKDMEIAIPAYSVHTDPEYFEEPDKFMPERFSGTEQPALFMPFGKGPRMCIGKRFAFIAMKTVTAKLVSEYYISPGTKTRLPVQLDPKTYFITSHPVDGIHVKLQKRNGVEREMKL